jgi:hypothetical protein
VEPFGPHNRSVHTEQDSSEQTIGKAEVLPMIKHVGLNLMRVYGESFG